MIIIQFYTTIWLLSLSAATGFYSSESSRAALGNYATRIQSIPKAIKMTSQGKSSLWTVENWVRGSCSNTYTCLSTHIKTTRSRQEHRKSKVFWGTVGGFYASSVCFWAKETTKGATEWSGETQTQYTVPFSPGANRCIINRGRTHSSIGRSRTIDFYTD